MTGDEWLSIVNTCFTLYSTEHKFPFKSLTDKALVQCGLVRVLLPPHYSSFLIAGLILVCVALRCRSVKFDLFEGQKV